MTPSRRVRVGTRGSPLARAQTEIALRALRSVAGDLEVEVVVIRTTGDRLTDRPFSAIGPKGLFAAELQRALGAGSIDLAVHSLKDLPSAEPEGLELGAVLERGEWRDALCSRDGGGLADLPPGAAVGTSSLRRAALLRAARPDLRVVPLRGNVGTRLQRVAAGEVDAAVLAGAGLVRLGRTDAVSEWLDFLPAPGQGAVCVEARSDRLRSDLAWVRAADHAPTRAAVEAERAFSEAVEGGCSLPLGALGTVSGTEVVCRGLVAAADGSRVVQASAAGPADDPAAVGRALAAALREAGGEDLLALLRGGAGGPGTA